MLPLLMARPLAQAFARGGLEMEKRFGFLLAREASEAQPGLPAGGLPDSVFADLFAYAIGETGRQGLAVEMKEKLPVGVFGPLDYLASAASSVAEATSFVCRHFGLIAGETELYVVDEDRQGVRVCVRNGKWFDAFELSDELALSLLAGRYCDLAIDPV